MASIRPPFNPEYFARPGAQGRSLDRGDLDRVLSLPRRPVLDLSSPEAEQLVDKWTARLARKTTKCECAALAGPVSQDFARRRHGRSKKPNRSEVCLARSVWVTRQDRA